MEAVTTNPMDQEIMNSEDDVKKNLLLALTKNITLLNGESQTREVAVIHRVLLFTPSLRKQLDLQDTLSFVKQFVSDHSPFKNEMIRIINKYIEVGVDVKTDEKTYKDIVDYYLASILAYQLYSLKQFDDCYTICNMVINHFIHGGYMDKQKEYIICRIFTYLMLLHNNQYTIPNFLPTLLSNYQICSLHNNSIACSAIYNSILRVYVTERNYLTAAHFLTTTSFPSDVSDKQFVRYCYYKALVSTVLLDYTEAEHCLFTIHKKSGGRETGPFYEEVMKLSIIVKLLTGENPDLSQIVSNRNLAPYRELATVVMLGDLSHFKKVVEDRNVFFKQARLDRVINRLHDTVIRIALVKLSKSYSRISLAEVASILQLENAEEARYTCMRNIRDGIISGWIEGEYFVTEELEDSVVTSHPKELFSKKIAFCLNLRKDIIKSSV